MPSYCRNELTVCADQETVRKLARSQFKFDKMLPAPCGEVPVQWFYDNWGTPKPPTEYECVLREPERLQVRFTTAWTPPFRFLEKLVRAMPAIESMILSWAEEDGDMSGVWRAMRMPGDEVRVEATSKGGEDWSWEKSERTYGVDWDWESAA